jgi:hypothetical protein
MNGVWKVTRLGLDSGPEKCDWMWEWELGIMALVMTRMEAMAPRRLLNDLYRSNEKNISVREDGEKGSVGPH